MNETRYEQDFKLKLDFLMKSNEEFRDIIQRKYDDTAKPGQILGELRLLKDGKVDWVNKIPEPEYVPQTIYDKEGWTSFVTYTVKNKNTRFVLEMVDDLFEKFVADNPHKIEGLGALLVAIINKTGPVLDGLFKGEKNE